MPRKAADAAAPNDKRAQVSEPTGEADGDEDTWPVLAPRPNPTDRAYAHHLGSLNFHTSIGEWPAFAAWTPGPGGKPRCRSVILDSTTEISLVSAAVTRNEGAVLEEANHPSTYYEVGREIGGLGAPGKVLISRWTTMCLRIGDLKERIELGIVERLEQADIVLGRDWISQYRPQPNWNKGKLRIAGAHVSFHVHRAQTASPSEASTPEPVSRLADPKGLTSRHLGKHSRSPSPEPLPTIKRKRLENDAAYPCPLTWVDPLSTDADQSYGTGRRCKESNPLGFREDLLFVAPGLRSKNCFVLQKHNATSKHYDLRLQVSHARDRANVRNSFISFAIPKGFSKLRIGHARLAVGTPPHTVAYGEYEGGPEKPTIVVDAGSYKILRSRRSLQRKRDSDSDTDKEDDEAREAWEMRKLLRKHSRPDGAFIIELLGTKYRLRLMFSRAGPDRYPRQRKVMADGSRKQTKRTIAHPQWIFKHWSMTPDEPSTFLLEEDTSYEERSILCGKTIEEVQEWARTPEGRRLHEVWLKKHSTYFRDLLGEDAEYHTDTEEGSAEAAIVPDRPAPAITDD